MFWLCANPNLSFQVRKHTRYNTNCEQQDIPEHGPMLSLGASRTVGKVISYFVAYAMEQEEQHSSRVWFLLWPMHVSIMCQQPVIVRFWERNCMMMMMMIHLPTFPRETAVSEKYLIITVFIRHVRAKEVMNGGSCKVSPSPPHCAMQLYLVWNRC